MTIDEGRIALQLRGSIGENSSGWIKRQELSPRGRLARSAKSAGIMLIFTLFAAAIPLAHFVLVPLGLLATLITFGIVFRARTRYCDGAGVCPHCTRAVEIRASVGRRPSCGFCPHCGARYSVESVEGK